MKSLYQPPSASLNIPYQPDETTVLLENPPRFTWMPARLDNEQYALQISRSDDFPPDSTRTYEPIPYNFFTPDQALEAGSYCWRYALLDGGERSEWSNMRSFTVPADLPETPLPSRAERYAEADLAHPRLWLNPEKVAALRERLRVEPDAYSWRTFYEQSVCVWLKRDLIPEPAPYPNNQRTAPLWRKMYMDCQEALYVVRHLSVAGVVLQDTVLLDAAKGWLLHLASWDVNGPTSRDYNDEAAFRVVGALAWGYDWLHGALTDAERDAVRESLLQRTRQVAYHVIERSKIHHVPYDSHAVRSLSSVLVPCCIALMDDAPEARQWLDYTLEYYACLYTPWGGQDGGWAEGPMYWTTGMAFLTEALNLLKNFTRLDFYRRPFFQKTGDFPLYCYSPDTRRASFGDQSNLGERPILKTAYNIRQFAAVTDNATSRGLYQWYYEQVKQYDTDPDSKFYNWGWWDFRFDNLMYHHDYPPVEPIAPTEDQVQRVKWFRDIGWVAFHERMDNPADHVVLLTKSSPYGSVSHSHGDQNAFLLHAFGEPLAIDSGYYVAHGSTIHRRWRRQTRSKNAILIDGKGQYADTDKVLCKAAEGKIERVESALGYSMSRADATAAYQFHVPYLKRAVREIYFVEQTYFVIVDYVDLEQPGRVDWLFHTLYQMELGDERFRVVGQQADLDARFVYVSSGQMTISQHDNFTDVDSKEYEGLPRHWHLTATTPPALTHRIVTLMLPLRKGDPRYVSSFIDDQGHGVMVYFTHEGHIHRIEVPALN